MDGIVGDLRKLKRPIGELSLLEGNPNDGDVDAMCASLEAFGQRKPVVCDEAGTVLAGNTTLKAARRLGWDHLAALETDDDDVKAKAFALADNRLGELGRTDEEALLAMMLEVSSVEELFGATGWTADDLEDLMGPGEPGDRDLDSVPDVETVPARTVVGDVWLLGQHRLMCGNSTSPTDVDRLLAGGDADMVWMDPPYNVAIEGKAGSIMNDDLSDDDFASLLNGCMIAAFGALRKGGAIYVAHGETERLAFSRAFEDAGFKQQGCIIWRKHAMVLSRTDYQPQHEPILYGWKPGGRHRWFGGRKQKSILAEDGPAVQEQPDGSWLVDLGERVVHITGTDVMVRDVETSVHHVDRPTSSDLHPTMKPVALVERHILNSSRVDDTVLDLFGGSGTTLMAAEQTKRMARLMELDPRFCDVICARFQEATGYRPIAEATGKAHDFR